MLQKYLSTNPNKDWKNKIKLQISKFESKKETKSKRNKKVVLLKHNPIEEINTTDSDVERKVSFLAIKTADHNFFFLFLEMLIFVLKNL